MNPMSRPRAIRLVAAGLFALAVGTGCVPNPFGPRELTCTEVPTVYMTLDESTLAQDSVGVTLECDPGYWDFCVVYVSAVAFDRDPLGTLRAAATEAQVRRCRPLTVLSV